MSQSEPFLPFVARRLWPQPLASADSERRDGITQKLLRSIGRLGYALARDLADGPMTTHAGSLVYTTLLSMVPGLALAFSVLKGFGVHYKFEPLLMSALAPLGTQAQVIADSLLAFVDRIEVGVLGAVGLAMLFYTAISVVQKIEGAFNEIWHIHSPRPLARRFTDYLSVLLIGPVLMFSALGLAASVLASEPVKQLSEIGPVWALIDFGTRLGPFLLVTATFVFLYKFLPNTRVRLRAAAIGGLVAGVIWALAGWAFAEFVKGASSYTAIYSAFAALILFLIWLNLNWLIVLIGAAIAFYVQHPEYQPLGRGRVALSNRGRERLALAVIQAIGRAHDGGERPPSTGELRRRLRVPEETLAHALEVLARAGLVIGTSADTPRWVPGRAFDRITLKSLIDAIRSGGERMGIALTELPADAIVIDTERRLDRALHQALAGLTVRSLAAPPSPPVTNGGSGSNIPAPEPGVRPPTPAPGQTGEEVDERTA